MNRSEQVRNEAMNQAYISRPAARDAERMANLARRDGEIPDAIAAEFEREAVYLCGRGYLEAVPDDVARGHVRFRITSAGIDWMEGQGFRA